MEGDVFSHGVTTTYYPSPRSPHLNISASTATSIRPSWMEHSLSLIGIEGFVWCRRTVDEGWVIWRSGLGEGIMIYTYILGPRWQWMVPDDMTSTVCNSLGVCVLKIGLYCVNHSSLVARKGAVSMRHSSTNYQKDLQVSEPISITRILVPINKIISQYK